MTSVNNHLLCMEREVVWDKNIYYKLMVWSIKASHMRLSETIACEQTWEWIQNVKYHIIF